MKTTVAFSLLGCICLLAIGSASLQVKPLNGRFEGTEPFWNMEIENNRVILHCMNDKIVDTVQLSKKQTHTETYAFKGRQVFGIIRESGKGGCTLDIAEKDYPSHEIYFSYKNETYMGCGWLNKTEK